MSGPVGGATAAAPGGGAVAEPGRPPGAGGRSGEFADGLADRFPDADPDGALDRYLVLGLLLRTLALAVPVVVIIALHE